jgi:hypothetical protein
MPNFAEIFDVTVRGMFLKELFAGGTIYQSSFDRICQKGFDSNRLAAVIHLVCLTCVDRRLSKIRTANLTQFSERELDRLQSDLDSLANKLDRLPRAIWNAHSGQADVRWSTTLNGWELQYMDCNELRHEFSHTTNELKAHKMLRKRIEEQIAQYKRLPKVLRGYAVLLARNRKLDRKSNRLKLAQVPLLLLMNDIQRQNGRSHYSELSTLLTRGFVICGGSETRIPKFFSADALAKLRQRTLKHYRSTLGEL